MLVSALSSTPKGIPEHISLGNVIQSTPDDAIKSTPDTVTQSTLGVKYSKTSNDHAIQSTHGAATPDSAIQSTPDSAK